MLQSVVLYTTANLLVKALAFLPTQQLVFLRSAVSLGFCLMWLWKEGAPLLGHNRRWLLVRGLAGMVALTFADLLKVLKSAYGFSEAPRMHVQN